MTNHQKRCTRCNNRLTQKDKTIILDLMTSHVVCGGRFTKEESLAFRRLKALRLN